MTNRCYRIGDDKRLVAVPQETALESWRRGDASYWLDLDSNASEALDDLLARAGLEATRRQMCLEEQDVPRFVPGSREVFFQFVTYSGASGHSTAYVSFVCLPRLLITFHAGPVESLATIATHLETTAVVYLTSTSALVCVVLLTLSSSAMRTAALARRRVDALMGRMDRDPEAVRLNEIIAEKSMALELDRIASENSYIMLALRLMRGEALNLVEFESSYQVAVTTMEFLSKSVGHHWLHLSELHERYVLNQQEKGNRRLSFLTVASWIFLPLTLMTGIYGMNFEHMPELKIWYAYPVFLLALLSVGSGILIYFKRKGWFV